MQANLADASGWRFECKPGCGFCCTASPLVGASEAGPLGPLVVRWDDGSLHIPLKGQACSALKADRGCGVYDARPTVCRLYPYQIHAGRRLQVSLTLACPGVERGEGAQTGAERAVEVALAQPGAQEMARVAKETFAEYDRRMKEWGHFEPPQRLISAFGAHLDALSRPAALPAFLAGLADGEARLDSLDALFETETEADLSDLLGEAAVDAFDANETVLWVDPQKEFQWVQPRLVDGKVFDVDPRGVPMEWEEDACAELRDYLACLTNRDHTEGAAAWLVDQSGYQATPVAAFGRVIAEASLHVVLRAGLHAAQAHSETITADLARRGIRAYETSYHSLPTIGAIL